MIGGDCCILYIAMDDQQDEANKLYAKCVRQDQDQSEQPPPVGEMDIAVMRFVLDFWRDPDFWKVLAIPVFLVLSW